MSTSFRGAGRFAQLAAALGGCLLLVSAPAVAQDGDVVRPMHNVVCSYTPNVPGAIGSVINARGDIQCAPTPPDVSSTALRIWRYNGGSSYTMMAEQVSNRRATSWSINAGGTCNTGRSHLFHTEIVNSSFHGTWDETINNSRAVRLTC